MSDSNEATPETAGEQQSSVEDQTAENTTTEQEPEDDTTQQSATEEQISDQAATVPEPVKSSEDDTTAGVSKREEEATLEVDDKEDEEPVVLDTSKEDDAAKGGEKEIIAKLEQVELTTNTETRDEDKPAKSDEAKEEENVAAAKEEEPVVPKQPRKVYCLDPTDTVDIAIGESGIRALKPMTIPQFIKRTVDKIPDGKALCWKDNKEASWQSLTYTEYLKLIYNTAKSFLKVLTIYCCMQCVCMYYCYAAWTGAISFSWYPGLQLSGMVCI